MKREVLLKEGFVPGPALCSFVRFRYQYQHYVPSAAKNLTEESEGVKCAGIVKP